MEAANLYGAFAVSSVLCSILAIWIIRRTPVWSYLASLLATCVLTHMFMSHTFSVTELGAFYPAVYAIGAFSAALGLIILHMLLRICLDLAATKYSER